MTKIRIKTANGKMIQRNAEVSVDKTIDFLALAKKAMEYKE